jgi:hypothetical protein
VADELFVFAVVIMVIGVGTTPEEINEPIDETCQRFGVADRG